MATKAIKITNGNVRRLEGEFRDVEENDLVPHIGFWMLVQFGSDVIHGFISDQTFKATIDVIGKLEHDWVDVKLKVGGPI